jgi:hypothetical protein
MRNLILIASLVLAVAGCKKKDKFEQAVSDSEGFRDKMCACKDKGDDAAKKECASGVKKEMKVWQKEMREKFKGDKEDKEEKEPAKDLLDRLDKAETETRACEKEAGGKGGGQSKIIREARDAICACKDMACANEVSKKMAAQASSGDMAMEKPTDDDMKVMKEMSECMTKLASSGGDKPAADDKKPAAEDKKPAADDKKPADDKKAEKKEGGGW